MDSEKNTKKRQKPNILVTGTPGVGKSTLCKLLVDVVPELTYISVGDIVNEKKLYKVWDKKFDCPIFDEDLVCDYMECIHEEGGVVVEFHTSNFFPERWFDLVILLRCENAPLYDRLKDRGYDEQKITENIECEILEVTADECKESWSEEVIMELRSDNEDDVEKNIELIVERLKEWAAKNCTNED